MIKTLIFLLVCSTLPNNMTSHSFLKESERIPIVFELNNISKSELSLTETNLYNRRDENGFTIKLFLKDRVETSDTFFERLGSECQNINYFEKLREYRDNLESYIFKNYENFMSNNQFVFDKYFYGSSIRLSRYSNVINIELTEEEMKKLPFNNFVADINSISDIEKVYVSDGCNNELLDEVYHPSLEDTLINIDAMNMVSSDQFTAKNVTLGILEVGAVPNFAEYPEYFSDRNIKISSEVTFDTKSLHADAVAIIASGSTSLASKSNLLAGGIKYLGDAVIQLEWMIKNGVNVVNTSFGSILEGTYDSVSEEIDRMVKNALVTIVGSAGNDGEYISSPKTGYNYITVGAADDFDLSSKASYSSFKEGEGLYASKPNLIAPGAIMTKPYEEKYSNTSYTPHGTSFASPLVAGSIALLMEEFPHLVLHPETVLSIITSSSSPMSSCYNENDGDNRYDGSGLHNQIGSGLLNYERARESARQSLDIMRIKKSQTGILPQYLDFTALNDQRIRASASWIYGKNSFTNYDLELYKVNVDGTMNKVAYISDFRNNVEFLDFDVKTPGTYRLVVNQKEINQDNDYIGLPYAILNDKNGSVSGVTNVDNTLKSHFKIDCSMYEKYGNKYNNEIKEELESIDGIGEFEVTRLRARFSDLGKLVLSAKSNDANFAFIEYDFNLDDSLLEDLGIYNLKYEFGLWSDDESLIRNSSIDLFGLKRGAWYLIRHFNPKEMSTNPNVLNAYIDCLDYPVGGFKFSVTTNYTNNNNNLGRVVIGDIECDIHSHNYSKYSKYDGEYHKALCGCGEYHLENHVWGSSYWIGSREYANCKKCNEQHNMNSGGPIVTPMYATSSQI